MASARPASRRQQQRTRVVAAAAVADVGSGGVADTAVAAAGDGAEEGGKWEDCLWDGQSWPPRSDVRFFFCQAGIFILMSPYAFMGWCCVEACIDRGTRLTNQKTSVVGGEKTTRMLAFWDSLVVLCVE